MAGYIKPEDVKSPKGVVEVERVLFPGEAGTFAVAELKWDGNECLGIRWNGTDENPTGFPQSRGNPTWLVLGQDIIKIIAAYHLDCLPGK